MSDKYALSAAQRRAAEILATDDNRSWTMAQIAEEVGVNERTIYRWKQEPDFIAYKNEVADRTMEDFISDAYKILRGIAGTSASEKSQLKALELVLKNRGKLTDVSKAEIDVKDSRSSEAIESEIEQLKRLLQEG